MDGGFALPKLFGLPIFVNWSAIVILAIGVLSGGGVNTKGELALALIYGCIVLGSILVHELGHALVATRIFHLGPASILIHGFGGLTRFRPPEKSWHAFVTALAGPSAGLLLGLVAAVVWLVAPVPDRVTEWILYQVARINIFWSLFNLLPMLPLDGGHMLLDALRMTVAPGRAEPVARVVSVVVAIAAGVGGIYTNNPFISIFALFSIVQTVRPRTA